MNRLERLIALNEGFRHWPYKDTRGIWTVGYGTNLEARFSGHELRQHKNQSCSKKTALRWMRYDLSHIDRQLSKRIPNYQELKPARQAVLIDMAYNLGIDGLFEFKRMLGAVIDRRWARAGREMEDSLWWNQVGNRSRRLRKMMETGNWPPNLPSADLVENAPVLTSDDPSRSAQKALDKRPETTSRATRRAYGWLASGSQDQSKGGRRTRGGSSRTPSKRERPKRQKQDGAARLRGRAARRATSSKRGASSRRKSDPT